MDKLKHPSAGKQLMLIFGLICAILAVIGMFLFFSLRAIERHNQKLQIQILREWKLSHDLSRNLSLEQMEVFRYVLANESEEIKRHDRVISSMKEAEAGRWNDYGALVDNATQRRMYARALQARKDYWVQTDSVLALGRVNRDMEAREAVFSSQAPVYEEYQKAINDIADWTAREGGDMANASTRLIVETRRIGDLLIGLAILITLGTGVAIAGITRRLKADNVALQIEIKERQLTEAQIVRIRNEHTTILNSVSEGVHWIDVDGRIKFENPAAANMLGYEASELIGRPAHLTMHHSHANGATYPVAECPIFLTMKDGRVRRVKDEVFWHKNGTSFPVEYTSTPVRNENGHLEGAVVVFTDVTDRKRIETRLLQSQKMETVGKLAGGVAHEFNSILTAIIGQSELLLGELPAGSSPAKNANEISKAAERAATLTRQLLAYGRKQILQPKILDLNQVIADMAGTLQHLMGREVEVRIVPAPGLKAVKIDPGQMEQVILNMAMNAADAMPNGGKFILETSNVTLDEEFVRPFPGLRPGGYIMLAITDTGMGMNDEVKSRAFDPFFSTKAVGEGTGLGLATCYGILKQSDGHINIYSEIARGTTFKIYLPQVEAQAPRPLLHLNASDLPRGTETILLAEDDPSLREMSATLLRRLGYTVLTATNGVEALSLKQQRDVGHIDLLFTDVVMPHMSGKELSDRIRAIYPQTKILFTSAYTETAIVYQGILNEGVTLLPKPFTPSALANKIRKVLDRPITT